MLNWPNKPEAVYKQSNLTTAYIFFFLMSNDIRIGSIFMISSLFLIFYNTSFTINQTLHSMMHLSAQDN